MVGYTSYLDRLGWRVAGDGEVSGAHLGVGVFGHHIPLLFQLLLAFILPQRDDIVISLQMGTNV